MPAARKTWRASASCGQSPIAYTNRSGGPVPTASWQAIRGRQIRNERHRHMRETLVHGCIREDMADHFRRALGEPYLVLAPESERHGTPRGRRDAQNADEQGKTWQTRETRRSGCSGGPRAGKCGTWQATRLAVRRLQWREREHCIDTWLSLSPRHGRPSGSS